MSLLKHRLLVHHRFVGGGLDDRFDFQLLTGEWFDGVGLEYIPFLPHVRKQRQRGDEPKYQQRKQHGATGPSEPCGDSRSIDNG